MKGFLRGLLILVLAIASGLAVILSALTFLAVVMFSWSDPGETGDTLGAFVVMIIVIATVAVGWTAFKRREERRSSQTKIETLRYSN